MTEHLEDCDPSDGFCACVAVRDAVEQERARVRENEVVPLVDALELILNSPADHMTDEDTLCCRCVAESAINAHHEKEAQS